MYKTLSRIWQPQFRLIHNQYYIKSTGSEVPISETKDLLKMGHTHNKNIPAKMRHDGKAINS